MLFKFCIVQVPYWKGVCPDTRHVQPPQGLTYYVITLLHTICIKIVCCFQDACTHYLGKV